MNALLDKKMSLIATKTIVDVPVEDTSLSPKDSPKKLPNSTKNRATTGSKRKRNADKETPSQNTDQYVRYDWIQIENEYVQGYLIRDWETGYTKHVFPTHEDLARKYGCSLHYMKVQSGKRQWKLKKDIFQTKLREKREEESINSMLSESSKFDAVHLHKIQQIHKLLDFHLLKYKELLTNDTVEGSYLFDPDDQPPVNLRDIETMMKILSNCHNLARNILGEPINAQQVREELNSAGSGDPASDPELRKKRIEKLSSKQRRRQKELEQSKLEFETLKQELAELGEDSYQIVI